ncbi:MAG: hypothetical protein KF901_12070 [Myxococcales bacterium]|nr:hypothetical protein [Myxococcales bacterium]
MPPLPRTPSMPREGSADRSEGAPRAEDPRGRPRSRRRRLWALALLGPWLVVPTAAQAPIEGNDFAVDAVATPVVASSRIMGLAGAFTALAEGIDGVPWNPAAYASRSLFEVDRVEQDLSASILFGGQFSANDYFLNGRGEGFGIEDFVFIDVGGRIQYDSFGAGATLQAQSYNLPTPGGVATATFLTAHVGAGYGLLDGQLVLGGGARAVVFDVAAGMSRENFFSLSGVGAELGGIFRHQRLPFRIGAAFRTPVDSRVPVGGDDGGQPQVEGLWRPSSVNLPWEIQVGFAVQLGPRPLNRRYQPIKDVRAGLVARANRRACERELAQVLRELGEDEPLEDLRCPNLRRRARDPEWRRDEALRRRDDQANLREEVARAEDEMGILWDELYESLPRRYLLISLDLLLHGPIANGVGIDAFFAQQRRARGEQWSGTFRLGLEAEPWAHRLKVRAGTYVEQARYAGVAARVHGTFGFEVRLFHALGVTWRANFVIDGARDYLSWGLGVGVWH